MLLIVSLKLLFSLDLTEAAMVHCVMSVAKVFGPRYEEPISARLSSRLNALFNKFGIQDSLLCQ